MSQASHEDLESGSDTGGNQTQPAPNQEESNFGDSSGQFFSIYSKAAAEEDKKMVERWQKDADGILIFTGLFSAAVAALLGVTVPDLRQNSQDTSAFYLQNIYEVLADPNIMHASIPSPIAEPRPFSPPRYAVYVNLLWFLSLLISLSCALLATSLQQWARRYIRLTQPTRCRPEKRARMRAFFADGVDKMHVPWAVEGLPKLLHLSLFLFFAGVVVFLFKIDQEIFVCVFLWIGLFLMVYGWITILPLIRHDSPYYTPLSKPIWFLYASIPYITFKVLAFITSSCFGSCYESWEHYRGLRDRYRDRMLGGVEKEAEEAALKQSSEIDVGILGWTISALDDDDSLERFFEAIPGLFNSKLVKNLEGHLSWTLLKTFWGVLDGFMGRTLSSNSVTDSVKSRRGIICEDIMGVIPCSNISIHDNLRSHFDRVPKSVERLQAMARWFTHIADDVSYTARIRAAKILARMKDSERDERWIAHATDVYGLSKRRLQHNVALGGDNVLLATLIDVSRRDIQPLELDLVEVLTQFDILQTLPSLQNDFCTLWNELIKKARIQEPFSTPVRILREIRNLYAVLHQGTDATPTAFSASIDSFDPILLQPSLYQFCNVTNHRPDSTAHVHVPDSPAVTLPTQPGDSPDASPHLPSHGGSTARKQAEKADINVVSPLPSNPTVLRKIGDSSRAPATTSSALPAHTDLRPTDTSPPGAVAAALQDTPPTVTLFNLLEGVTQRDMVESRTEPDISEILSTSPTALTAAAAASNSLLPSPSFSLGSTTPSGPSGNKTLRRLRARGLVNTGSMCFANAVLQLLVHSPQFRDLFRELGDLKRQRGAGGPETGDSATPVADATERFLEEFIFVEEPPSTEEQNFVDPFEPTYMYDAMKEKTALKNLLDGRQQDAEEFFHLYLDELDKELPKLIASIGGCISTTAVPGVEEPEASQSRHTDVGERGFMAESVRRLFGGKFRSIARAPNQPDTVTIEDWRPLQLDIQDGSVHTIEDALARVSHPQPVNRGPSGPSEASQQVFIEALPLVLVLHLKRFLYDAEAVKINKTVQFAPVLKIPPEIMVPVAGRSPEPIDYKLYGVLYHHGKSAGSGHYTVDVLHPNGDSGGGESWLHIDDEAVCAARHDDVFLGHNDKRVDNRCAYMLFYYRTAPTQT